jgi:hypothetical protein
LSRQPGYVMLSAAMTVGSITSTGSGAAETKEQVHSRHTSVRHRKKLQAAPPR